MLIIPRNAGNDGSRTPPHFYHFSVKSRTTNQRIMISRCGPRWQHSNLVWQHSPAPTLATQPGSTSTGSTCNRFAPYKPTTQPRTRDKLSHRCHAGGTQAPRRIDPACFSPWNIKNHCSFSIRNHAHFPACPASLLPQGIFRQLVTINNNAESRSRLGKCNQIAFR